MKAHTAVGSVLDSYIKNNIIILVICTACVVLGIITGSIYCVTLKDTTPLSHSLGNFELLESGHDSFSTFLSSITNLMQLAFFIWLCGLTRLGVVMAPFILALKGFACGFCTASLVLLHGASGLLAAAVGIAPQMLVMFIVMEVFCVAAINQCLFTLKTNDKMQKRRRFIAYCIFCLLLTLAFGVCSLFESYVSPYLLLWALKM